MYKEWVLAVMLNITAWLQLLCRSDFASHPTNFRTMVASGENIVPGDEKELPYFDGLTERIADMYEKILGVYYTNDSVFIAHRMKFASADKSWHSLFTDGNALYYFEPIGCNVHFDYGFLPMPKYDESQEEYITPIVHLAHIMHVTTAQNDLEMVRVVLENLAAESHRTVREVLFITAINTVR